jgi:hypothetical protein
MFSVPNSDFFFNHLLIGASRSFPLERFQAPREKESFVIDSIFIPVPDSQTQKTDAIQLRLVYAAVCLKNCMDPFSSSDRDC